MLWRLVDQIRKTFGDKRRRSVRSDTRLKLTNPDVVRNDGNNRILLAQVPVAQ